MKSYPKYKPSKIVWFSEIPENWDYCKVKHIANTYAGGTPSTVVDSFWHNGDIPWLPSGKLQNCEITSAEKFITQEGLNGSSTKWIKPNTVLVALTGATCANIGYLTFKACANQSVIAIDENPEKANSRFLYYMFLNMRSQILTHQTGGAQAGINDSDVKNLYLLKPSLEEQIKIADYLDYKTNLIDATIEKKKRLIELLKEKRQAVINEAVTKGLNPNAPMKDSGVEWLGEIPEHWMITSIKNILEIPITDGPHSTPNFVDDGIPFISAESIKNGKIDFSKQRGFITEEDYNEFSKKYLPELEDIYMVKSGATTGNIAMVEDNIKFTIWSPLAVFRAQKELMNSFFLRYFLESSSFRYSIERSWSYGTQQNIGMGVLSNLKITYPSIDEQIEINNHINLLVSSIDITINKIETVIEKLQTYRQSLISEAVTGKIDVREWQITNN